MKIKEFKWIPLNQLKVSEENIRKTMVDREKEHLKQSIKKLGILDVLTVVYNEDKQTYEIIKGQRRFLAAKELKSEGVPIKELPCIVKEKEDPKDSTQESLVDEIQRISVENNDTARAIVKLVQYYGSMNKTSLELGEPESTLDWYLQHLALNEPASAIETPVIKPKSQQELPTQELQPETKTDEFAQLSFEEKKEADRRVRETPNLKPALVVSATKDWLENSRELNSRYEESTVTALSDWAKNPQPKIEVTMTCNGKSITFELPGHDQTIDLRRALDIMGNELYKAQLRLLRFRT